MSWFGRGSPQERFAADVLHALRGSVDGATYDPEQFAIAYRRHGHEGWIYLQNTFAETTHLPRAGRRARIRALVNMTIERPPERLSWEQTRPRLRPVLRGVTFGRIPGQPHAAATLLSRPALPFLDERVVLDQPTSMAYVLPSQAAEWGVTEDEAFAAARANLADSVERLLAGPGRAAGEGPAVLRFVDSGDAYFTSMLLVDGFLARLSDHVGGRPVAFVPENSALIVAADSPALPALYELVEREFGEAVRRLSPVAYTVDDGGRVVPYRAPAGSDVARIAHRAEVILASHEYESQTAALTAEVGDAVAVAAPLVVERPDHSLFSVAVWPERAETLLPRADLVTFGSGRERLTVAFAAVEGEALPPPESACVPERYRVHDWPTDEVMNRLRPLAVDP